MRGSFIAARRGSSPRLWGTRRYLCGMVTPKRFIPTLVGNTTTVAATTSPLSVHPHACGEHANDKLNEIMTDGSSPRLWGTRCIIYVSYLHSRFIPTLVGNTRVYQPKISSPPVHPHACGEHVEHSAVVLNIDGSSPRLWGTRICYYSAHQCWRFIPTLVGNTSTSIIHPLVSPVHPHACGEHGFCGNKCSFLVGSSPRLWGTLLRFYKARQCDRFIPTLVGNTISRVP